MLTRETLLKKRAEVEAQKMKLMADLNACEGAEQVIDQLLSELERYPDVERNEVTAA